MNILLMFVGGYAVVTATKWQFLSALGPGAGFFPTIVGVGMVLAAAVSILEDAAREGFRIERPDDAWDWGLTPRVLASIGGVLVFAMIAPTVGFTIAIAVLTFVVYAQYALIESRGRSRTATLSKGLLLSVVNAVAMIVLLNALRVQLPRNAFDDLVSGLIVR